MLLVMWTVELIKKIACRNDVCYFVMKVQRHCTERA